MILAGGCTQPPAVLNSPTPTIQTPSAAATNTPKATATTTTSPSPLPTQTLTPTPTKTPKPEPTVGPLFSNCRETVCYFPFNGILALPISNDYVQDVEHTYRYGSTQYGDRLPHDGVEFYNPSGTPVLASADGIVIYTGTDTETQWGRYHTFYGNLVIIEHDLPTYPQPIYTLYAHLSQVFTEIGMRVKQGEMIGAVGVTGSAFGSHLHYEVRVASSALHNTQNPELFLALKSSSDEAKTGILAGSVLDKTGLVPGQEIVIQKITEEGLQINQAIYLESYAKDIPNNPILNENFLISNLPVGEYRISTFINQKLVETNFFIYEDQLSYINLINED